MNSSRQNIFVKVDKPITFIAHTLKKIYQAINLNIIIIIIYIGFSCFYGSLDHSSQSLTAHDEGLYAGRAKLIIESNNWLTPFGEAHYKTVGSYWLIALSFKIFGYSEFSARLPSGLFAIFCSITLYHLCKEFLSDRAALFAALILPTMPLWIQYSRYASPDISYIFFVLLIILFLVRFNRQKDKTSSKANLYLFLIGTCLGFSFFLRSLMVVLPIFALFPYFYKTGVLTSYRYYKFVLLGLLIGGLPSIISILFAYDEFGIQAVSFLFGFAKDKAVTGYGLKSILFYPRNIFLLTFPISLFSFIAITSKQIASRHLRPLFLFYPIIIIILLCTISTRYSHYSLVIIPIISLLFALTYDIILSSKYQQFTLIRKLLGLTFICFGSLYPVAYQLTRSGFLDQNLILNFYPILPLSIIYIIIGCIYQSPNLHKNIFISLFIILCFVQSTTLTHLYGRGIMGNPNPEIKTFVNDISYLSITKSNPVYLINVSGKAKTLLQFYLPSFIHTSNSLEFLDSGSYFMIDDQDLINSQNKSPRNIIKLQKYKSWQLGLLN